MSELTEAAAEFLDAQEEAVGSRLQISIAGTLYDVTPAVQIYNSEFVGGGTAESGSQTVGVRKSDLPTKPAKKTVTIYNGQTLAVEDVSDDGVWWLLTISDPASWE